MGVFLMGGVLVTFVFEVVGPKFDPAACGGLKKDGTLRWLDDWRGAFLVFCRE